MQNAAPAAFFCETNDAARTIAAQPANRPKAYVAQPGEQASVIFS